MTFMKKISLILLTYYLTTLNSLIVFLTAALIYQWFIKIRINLKPGKSMLYRISREILFRHHQIHVCGVNRALFQTPPPVPPLPAPPRPFWEATWSLAGMRSSARKYNTRWGRGGAGGGGQREFWFAFVDMTRLVNIISRNHVDHSLETILNLDDINNPILARTCIWWVDKHQRRNWSLPKTVTDGGYSKVRPFHDNIRLVIPWLRK